MGWQGAIQLPSIAGNIKCLFASLFHWDKEGNLAHPAVINIFALLIHLFGAMVYSNQTQVFQKRSKFIYTKAEEWLDQVESIANKSLNRKIAIVWDIPILFFYFHYGVILH
jgi:hypothetical protein